MMMMMMMMMLTEEFRRQKLFGNNAYEIQVQENALSPINCSKMK